METTHDRHTITLPFADNDLARQLFGERFAVIDNMMRARFPYPFLAFRTRGGANDRHTGELAGELGQYRTDAARRADDQQRVARVAAFLYAKAVEQQLPGGDGGER